MLFWESEIVRVDEEKLVKPLSLNLERSRRGYSTNMQTHRHIPLVPQSRYNPISILFIGDNTA